MLQIRDAVHRFYEVLEIKTTVFILAKNKVSKKIRISKNNTEKNLPGVSPLLISNHYKAIKLKTA